MFFGTTKVVRTPLRLRLGLRHGRSATRRNGLSRSIAALTCALVASTAVSASASSPPAGPLVPSHGALFGAYVNPAGKWVSLSSTKNDVATLESQIGRKLAIDEHFYSWTQSFPTPLETWDIQNGRIPMDSWEGVPLRSIVQGKYDSMIRKRAHDLKALGKQVFLRWGYEMNGDWNSWDGYHNGHKPRLYVAAWRHIHGIFAAAHANNVVWVWAPNCGSVPRARWNRVQHYYPGSRYVDWVGIDGYNWGTTQSWSRWISFANIFSHVYKLYSNQKPIMIAEVGSVEQGGSKADWFAEAASQIQNQFPAVDAFVYLDNPPWDVTSSSTSLAAYKTMAQDAYFNP